MAAVRFRVVGLCATRPDSVIGTGTFESRMLKAKCEFLWRLADSTERVHMTIFLGYMGCKSSWR